MTRHVLPLLFVCLLAPVAAAENVLMIAGDDYYLVTLGADGPTIEKFGKVVRVGDVPDDEPPGDPDSVTGKVEAWTKAVNEPTIAAGLSEGYGEIRKLLQDGTINWAQAKLGLKGVTGLVVSQSEDAARWKAWRENVSDLISEHEVDGKLQNQEQQVQFLADVQAGLDGATKNRAIKDVLLKLLIQLIEAFIDELLGGL